MKKTVLFAGMHYGLQIAVYALAFALGPGRVTHRVLGISLFDVAVVITFPSVFLAEKHPWLRLGLGGLCLNSVIWASLFYLILMGIEKLSTKFFKKYN